MGSVRSPAAVHLCTPIALPVVAEGFLGALHYDWHTRFPFSVSDLSVRFPAREMA